MFLFFFSIDFALRCKPQGSLSSSGQAVNIFKMGYIDAGPPPGKSVRRRLDDKNSSILTHNTQETVHSLEFATPATSKSASVSGSVSTSRQTPVPQALTAHFPTVFNIYSRSKYFMGRYILGEHQNEPFYLSVEHPHSANCPPVVLHAGVDDTWPLVGSAQWEKDDFGRAFIVDIPSLLNPEGHYPQEMVEWQAGSTILANIFGNGTFRFSLKYGEDGQQVYEWRYSTSGVAKNVIKPKKAWILVRLDEGSAGNITTIKPGASDPVDHDGCEIVAAWGTVDNSLSKVATFGFAGNGARGKLGEKWAIVAVVSFLVLFQWTQRVKSHSEY